MHAIKPERACALGFMGGAVLARLAFLAFGLPAMSLGTRAGFTAHVLPLLGVGLMQMAPHALPLSTIELLTVRSDLSPLGPWEMRLPRLGECPERQRGLTVNQLPTAS